MSAEKVIDLPVKGSVTNVLWLIAIHPSAEEKCDLKTRKNWNGWNAEVHAKTLERAVEIVWKCCDELGLEV